MKLTLQIGIILFIVVTALTSCMASRPAENIVEPSKQPTVSLAPTKPSTISATPTPTTSPRISPSPTPNENLRPIDAFRAVLNALSRGDNVAAKNLTCKEMQEHFDTAPQLPAVDFTGANLTEMSNDGHTAVISVTGSIKWAGDTVAIPAFEIEVVKQNNMWIFCDNLFRSSANANPPTQQGIYLSLTNDYVGLIEFEGWPNALDAIEHGKIIFMADLPQPHIRVQMQGWTVEDVRLLSSMGDSIDIEVTQSDPNDQFFEIQPTKKLERGQYCIARSSRSTDKRHWCFNNVEVIQVPDVQQKQS